VALQLYKLYVDIEMNILKERFLIYINHHGKGDLLLILLLDVLSEGQLQRLVCCQHLHSSRVLTAFEEH